MSEPVIAVFGAAGKTGRAVVQALRESGVGTLSIRPLVRTGAAPPAVAVEFGDDASVRAAVDGADVLYLLAPNLYPDEPALVARAVSAAVGSGVRRIVYHSVLRPGVEAMPHHWGKLRAEELLWGSGLDVTVLQPSAYAQNLTACIRDGELVVPYSVDVPFSLVDLADVADAAAQVLLDPASAGATFELAGPVTTVRAVAEALHLHPRRHRVSSTASGYAAEALEAMFDWYDAHGLTGNPAVLRWLLGREARDAVDVLHRLPERKA